MKSVKAAAEQIADSLFTGGNREMADRLVLRKDATQQDLGGWCRQAVVAQIVAVLSEAIDGPWLETLGFAPSRHRLSEAIDGPWLETLGFAPSRHRPGWYKLKFGDKLCVEVADGYLGINGHQINALDVKPTREQVMRVIAMLKGEAK